MKGMLMGKYGFIENSYTLNKTVEMGKRNTCFTQKCLLRKNVHMSK